MRAAWIRETTALQRNYVNAKVWKPALLTVGLLPTRENGMHALRHFYAIVLLDAGESIRALAEYLGHADPGSGVVPPAVEFVGLDLVRDSCHLSVGDLDATGVAAGVGFGVDGQAGAGGRRTDELDEDFVTGEGAAAPVAGDC